LAFLCRSASESGRHRRVHRGNRLKRLLVQLADDAAALGDEGLDLALSVRSEAESPETRDAFFRLLADRFGARKIAEAAVRGEDWAALSAALASIDDNGPDYDWVTQLLSQFADSDPERVPELLLAVTLDPERLDVALGLTEDGTASGAALGWLVYGARIKDLDEPRAVRLIAAVGRAGETEAALGMIHQWIEDSEAPPPTLMELAAELALEGVSTSGTPMGEYYIEQLVKIRAIPASALVGIWQARLRNRDSLVDGLDVALTEAILVDPSTSRPRIYELIKQRDTFGLYFLYRPVSAQPARRGHIFRRSME
jgi:hypothetical protein